MRYFWGFCVAVGFCLLLRSYLIPSGGPSVAPSVDIGFTDSKKSTEQPVDKPKVAATPVEDPTFTTLLSQAEHLGFKKDSRGQPIILVSRQQRTAYVYMDGKLILTSEVRIPEHNPPYANRLVRLGPFNSCDGGYTRPECDIHPKFSGNSRIPGTPDNVSLLGPIAISIEGSQNFLVHGVPTDQRLLNILGDYTSGCIALRNTAALQEFYRKASGASSSWLLYMTSG